jgi:hypothetical protein
MVSVTLPRHGEIWLADYLRSVARAKSERVWAKGIVDIFSAVTEHCEPRCRNAPYGVAL